MLKPFLFLLWGLGFLVSCTTTQDAPSGSSKDSAANTESSPPLEQKYFRSHPVENRIVIIGIARNHLKEKDTIEAARNDAAQKVAFYHGITGEVTITDNKRGSYLDHPQRESKFTPHNSDFESYKSMLQYDPKDIVKVGTSMLIPFTYPVSDMRSLNLDYGFGKEKPYWMEKKNYTVPGFLTAIGQAGHHERFRDTVMKSYENAMEQILSTISAVHKGEDTDNGRGGSSTKTEQKSEGDLIGFLVLEIWIDTKGVYTLAIAKDPTSKR
jgi:hypothetical protein